MFAVVISLPQAPAGDLLARARTFYNEWRYDDAIEAATDARKVPALEARASVVLARAYIERYRTSRADPGDLTTGREVLKAIDTSKLPPRDHVEYLVGLGESLYYDDLGSGQPPYGAAAAVFELALNGADAFEPAAREPIFEWWAGALDLQAQFVADAERKLLYARILRRAEQELDRNISSASASYWLAASARGTDDIERAWGAAVAAWIRAPQFGPRGVMLRQDLDRLITEAILPQRARLFVPAGEIKPELDRLLTRWDDLKKRYQ
jgi:hypothetical protein